MNEERKELLKKYVPTVLLPCSTAMMVINSKAAIRQQAVLLEGFERLTKEYGQYRKKAFKRLNTNNWLKMHGYPMKRRKYEPGA